MNQVYAKETLKLIFLEASIKLQNASYHAKINLETKETGLYNILFFHSKYHPKDISAKLIQESYQYSCG